MSEQRVQLCVLASGSGGNCTVLRSPAGSMLIDIGIGPRTFGRRLAMAGEPQIAPQEIAAACLTHLDSDHFNASWFRTLARFGIALFCHADLVERVRERAPGVEVRGFDCDSVFEPIAGLRFRALACEHDEAGSHGFVVDGFSTRIGFATDLGHVPNELFDVFGDLDLLCIESNYDHQMQLASDRPHFLKRRVMGGKGHLSNDQAFRAVVKLLDQYEADRKRLPRHIVLLHRSRDCNCPMLLRKVFSSDRRIARRLVLAEQFDPTPWLAPGTLAGEQLILAWG